MDPHQRRRSDPEIRIREKELEELVVVLFAKVEIPRH